MCPYTQIRAFIINMELGIVRIVKEVKPSFLMVKCCKMRCQL